MIEYGKDINDGDYVRLATLEEYESVFPKCSDLDKKLMSKFGGRSYKVVVAKYNGKIVLTGGEYSMELETFAFPPAILYPWHEEKDENNEISMTEFANIIGVQT